MVNISARLAIAKVLLFQFLLEQQQLKAHALLTI
jgi:hypothetical protein